MTTTSTAMGAVHHRSLCTRLQIALLRPFSRPRAKYTVLRLLVAIGSVAAILVLLSSRKPSHDAQALSDDDNHISHPGRRTHTTLSAKDRETYKRLNPVISGWGDNGEAVYLQSKAEEKEAEKQFKAGAFNVYISDRISPNRSLPDPRPFECSKVDYSHKLDKLGTASVVIIFTDEIWSALIRTMWSVWMRTPDRILKEIILVDDASSRKELQEPLEKYCAHYFGDRVRILRTGKREGLIRARIMGAKKAEGDVLLFLDSHCEVTTGWLEPLLATIAKDRRNVVCPVIDVIGDKNLDYSVGNPYYFQVGGFTWSGHFTWIDIPEDYTKLHPTSPVPSPTMAGGLFAMDKSYFFELGAYDEAMEIWGGENLEMSFRVWQCQGKLLIHPCSHVGHIFRDYHPYSFQGKDTHGINTLRTILVWMDSDYHRYFFMYRNDLKNKRAGDLSARFKLKNDLQCKSFRWYLEEVFKKGKFIYDVNVKGYGSVRNPISNLCFDILNRDEEKTEKLGLFTCSPRPESMYTNQVFSFTNSGEIRREETCATANVHNKSVEMAKCTEDVFHVEDFPRRRKRSAKKQTWRHTKGGQIINEKTKTCISTRNVQSSGDLVMEECNPDDMYQIWWFQTYTDINPQ